MGKILFLGFLLVCAQLLPKLDSTVQLLPTKNNVPEQITLANTQDISRNWSGYTASGGTFTGVSARWTVPQVKNDNSFFGADATWVGIGGIQTDDLIQVGTQAIVDPMGHVNYEAFYETLPDASVKLSLAISAGDTVQASLTKEQDSNIWDLILRDMTTKKSESISVRYESLLSSAEWIEEAPSGTKRVLPLDNFGQIHFTNATAIKNGNVVSISAADAHAVKMGNFDGTSLANASVIGNDGLSFSVVRSSTNQRLESLSSGYHKFSFGGFPFAIYVQTQ